MFKLADTLETDAPVEQVRSASAALGAATDGFAGQRMNASISKALSGRTMDSLA
jgi:molecular chaperone HscA